MKTLACGLLLLLGIFAYFERDAIALHIYKHGHNGLINRDHGILSKADLVKAGEGYLPPARFDGRQESYPYWQCFDKKQLKAKCDYSEPLDQPGSSIGIDITTESEIHSYSLPHAISGEICAELLARMGDILKNETHFCINGWAGTLDRISDKKEFSWTFENFKTNAGYANLLEEERPASLRASLSR